MNIKEIYDYFIETGMKNDPRTAGEVKAFLAREKEKYDELKEDEKKEYDLEALTNPYSDTRILHGDPAQPVERAMVGIDIDAGEVMLADRLGEKGKKVDLIIAHHPSGKALSGLHEVMHLQEDILVKYGVPVNIAESIMEPRIKEVKQLLMPMNHNRALDAAKLLGIPLMCAHTVADNQVVHFLQELLDGEKPRILGDLLKILKAIPEYAEATKYKAGPEIMLGSENRSAGKILVDMTGGTGGSDKAFENLSRAGVSTIVGMHISDKNRKKAEENHVNVVIAGHIASDSLGMNLLLDGLEKKGVEVISCSGMIRNSRV